MRIKSIGNAEFRSIRKMVDGSIMERISHSFCLATARPGRHGD